MKAANLKHETTYSTTWINVVNPVCLQIIVTSVLSTPSKLSLLFCHAPLLAPVLRFSFLTGNLAVN
ncbi:uncharacterized protein LACBIDRAFT_296669 [Laccaria bicolor S238N-H82]|uniref:Predicted protein n=1 Tax=Laccaria bicolor (strain S238N-H82 / ATCC MYA-4686) TaxID=486041 RepID=B0D9D7_LACBS|nr:uncharacterized protein LACBIDRAFT_296669 [Laccaria bicolor S238N-H82]EDR09229.1 predicted protein [Laccaria bicolor S238N-H82]|eukprot:XP_001880542.1 predicted protein [Laccaria bicolor S238N-H82]